MLTQGDLYHDHLNVYGKRLLGKLAFMGNAGQSHILCGLPSVGSPSSKSLIRSDDKLISSWVR
jgi:hypothetical protein